jgi:hypothetical protein
MHYYLGKLALGSSQWFPIEPSHYTTIREHKSHLIRALEIEERFDILLGNFRELEEDILTMALRHAVIPAQQTTDWNAQRRKINRRLANLLSSARLYLDHLRHDAKAILGEDSVEYTELIKGISAHFDESFSYRLMEALRNHVQHRGLAAPSFSVNHQLTEARPGAEVACTVTPQMMKRYLLADSKLTAKIRSEIEALSDATDLKPHVRQYVSRLNQINNKVRVLIAEQCPPWEATIRDAMQEFRDHFSLPADDHAVGLAVFQSESEMPAPITERHDVFMDFIEYRKHLVKVNQVAERLADHFATGQQRETMKTR